MNPPNKEDGTAAATTNDESALLGATASIRQDSHGDDGEPLRPAAAHGAGLEIIEDDDGPWIPPSMSAMPFDGDSPDLDAARTAASRYVGKPAKAWLEEIKEDTRPDIPVSMMEFTDSKKMEPIVTRPPRPINIAEIGDEEDASKKGQPPPRRQIAREDSIVIPPSEDMEGEVVQIITNRRGGRAEEFLLNANVAPSNPGAYRNEDEEANVQNGNPEDLSTRPDFERVSTFRVLEAVLVDDVVEDVVEDIDDEVYIGTHVEPHVPVPPPSLRKLKQVTIALVCAAVIAVAVALGIDISARSSNPPLSNAPSTSSSPSRSPSSSQMPTSNSTTMPSTSPSLPPSTSIAPSSSLLPSTRPSSSQMPTSNPTTLPSTSPSLPPSIAPSSSVLPSTSPSTSMAPSSSTSPTSCYWLSIAIDYDEKPEETYWKLWGVISDDWEQVKYHYASAGDTSYSESICLEEGEYDFTIFGNYDARDGICCDHGEGSYNVTVDGTLIVEGGEFGWWEQTVFSLPFVPGTNETTQIG